MELVIVERSFEQPVNMEALAGKEQAVDWCLRTHRVQPLYSWVANDGAHAVCFYRAPDAEAVRKTQATGGLPFDHVWTARPVLAEDATFPAIADGFSHVVVQRAWPVPVSLEEALETKRRADPCNQTYRVDGRESFLSADGLRTICCFSAPDAEAVRTSQRQNGIPFVRAWSATRFGA